MNDPIVRSFMKQFEQQAYGQGHYSEVFEDFLDYCIFYLSLGTVREPVERLAKKYGDAKMEGFLRLFEILGEGSEDFNDMLGTLYMEISSQYKASAMGQFFTPGNIAAMMAEINLAGLDTSKEGQTINDPTCGSGVMLLKAAKKFGDNRHLQYFEGADLDRICCKMCAINMALNTIPGRVYHANTLTLQYFGAYTLKLTRLGGKWLTAIVKWPAEEIDKINERVQQDRSEVSKKREAEQQEEAKREAERKIEEKLRAKDAKKGFSSTLFD